MHLCVGFKGTALKWFQSYMSDKSFSVHLGQYSSSVSQFIYGVPQGSFFFFPPIILDG